MNYKKYTLDLLLLLINVTALVLTIVGNKMLEIVNLMCDMQVLFIDRIRFGTEAIKFL